MGWYFRRSVSAGPFRLNFSKSGLGISTGVRGFRVSAGKRGTYVTVGSGGIYYRQRLSGGRRTPTQNTRSQGQPRQQTPAQPVHQPRPEVITSTQMDLVDTNPDEFLQEFNRRAGSGPWFTIAAVVLAAILIVTAGGSSDTTGILFGVGLALVIGAYIYDHKRRTTSVTFELDPGTQTAFDAVRDAFQNLTHTQKLRLVSGYDRVLDGRYHAGAGQLLSEKPAAVRFGGVPYLKTTPPVPTLVAAERRLVFLPDRLLLMNGRNARSFSYDELRVTAADSTYIESGVLPSEARVVGHTWRFVNKSGSPDRRFKDNRQIPKVNYEFGRFVTSTGLQEVFYSSYPDRLAAVGRALRQLSLAHHPAPASAPRPRSAPPPAPPSPAASRARKPAVAAARPRATPTQPPSVRPASVADDAPIAAWARLGVNQETLKAEIHQIRSEKGYAWSYQLFACSLMQAVLRADPLRQGWATMPIGNKPCTPQSFLDAIEGRFARVEALVAIPSKIFSEERLASLRDDSGSDPMLAIAGLALEYQHLYEQFMHWSMEIRAWDLGHRDANLLRDQMAAFIKPTLRTLEDFPWELRDQVGEIADAGKGELTLKLRLTTEDPEKLLASIRGLHKLLVDERR